MHTHTHTHTANASADFVLSYCSNGELLRWIKKLSSFDVECTRFYAAELTSAIEYMHSVGIIHR